MHIAEIIESYGGIVAYETETGKIVAWDGNKLFYWFSLDSDGDAVCKGFMHVIIKPSLQAAIDVAKTWLRGEFDEPGSR